MCIIYCIFTEISRTCCRDVLSYVAEEINKDWYHFLHILSYGFSSLVKEMQVKSGKENVYDFFESTSFQIKWSDMERTLHAMEKDTMINYIERNFLYTQGNYKDSLLDREISSDRIASLFKVSSSTGNPFLFTKLLIAVNIITR